ncbi:ADP,ATP carrier protein 3 [Eurytemora carolleeae]|uniref:ADP,ATP carrier protein 3 n=1 Tax=Eurytemora carolleeae TaxID=1294199 RepID=UPI000C78BAFC|nr:ADP,ATP carrier protein 3 [Eurytemora carolleeae]|eukprot:XP_023330555.1 ADP,ATP carrier protein 3-like [Eurytemora affinis]
MKKKENLGFAENFFLSGTAAALSKTGAAPIERVKLLIQNQGELLKQGRLDKGFSGVQECVTRTFSSIHQHPAALPSIIQYPAALPSILQHPVAPPSNFQLIQHYAAPLSILPLLYIYIITDTYRGVKQSFILSRLGVDAKNGGKRQFNGILDVYVKTIRADGVLGLYRGFWVSCTCIFIYRGLYFGLFDSLKPIVLNEGSYWLHTFLLGWIVTITSGLAAYPIDTVKRRMMMTAGQEVKYTSSIACLKEVVAREGYYALYRGAGVNIVRGVAGAGVLTGFDKFKQIYISRRKHVC